MQITPNHLKEAREYAALCDEARALGVPTSLDDPRSPRTVAGLRAAVIEELASRLDDARDEMDDDEWHAQRRALDARRGEDA